MDAFKKEHFMAIVGFYGNTALVNKKLSSQVKKMDVSTLLEKGFLSQAVSGVFFDSLHADMTEEMAVLCNHFSVNDFQVLLQQFGVHTDVLTGGKYIIRFI